MGCPRPDCSDPHDPLAYTNCARRVAKGNSRYLLKKCTSDSLSHRRASPSPARVRGDVRNRWAHRRDRLRRRGRYDHLGGHCVGWRCRRRTSRCDFWGLRRGLGGRGRRGIRGELFVFGVRCRFPSLGGVTGFAARRESVVAGERHAFSVVFVATDALVAREAEHRRVTAVAPEALHAVLSSGELLIGGRPSVRAGQRPERMIDPDVMPGILRVADSARRRTRSQVWRVAGRIEFRRVAPSASRRILVCVNIGGAATVASRECGERECQGDDELRRVLHGTSCRDVGKAERAFARDRAARRNTRRSPPLGAVSRSRRGGRPSRAARGTSASGDR